MRLEPHPKPGELADFDKRCVESLNRILGVTDAEIVVSSDWKYWVPIEVMRDFYASQGVIKTPLDYTPGMRFFNPEELASGRAREIIDWLRRHPKVEKWVWVDDLDMRTFIGNAVWVKNPTESIGIKGFENRITWIISFPSDSSN